VNATADRLPSSGSLLTVRCILKKTFADVSPVVGTTNEPPVIPLVGCPRREAANRDGNSGHEPIRTSVDAGWPAANSSYSVCWSGGNDTHNRHTVASDSKRPTVRVQDVVRRRNTNTQYSNAGGERDIYCAFPQNKIARIEGPRPVRSGPSHRRRWLLAPTPQAETYSATLFRDTIHIHELCVRLPTGLNPKPSQE
jgi:hypothetical protein